MAVLVPPCTRFPTPLKKGPGRPDRGSRRYLDTTIVLALLVLLLVALAVRQLGGGVVMTTLAIEFAVQFAVTVGGRVQGRTGPLPAFA